MLEGFEDVTYELHPWEEEWVEVLIVLLKGTVIGYHLTAEELIARSETHFRTHSPSWTDADFKRLSGARIRKMINHIRSADLLPGLIANSKGYYVTTDSKDMERWIRSIEGRINALEVIKTNAQKHMKEIKRKEGGTQATLFD